jgi:hypothetical protein
VDVFVPRGQRLFDLDPEVDDRLAAFDFDQRHAFGVFGPEKICKSDLGVLGHGGIERCKHKDG